MIEGSHSIESAETRIWIGNSRRLVALGLVTVAVIVLVTFYPALKIGFFSDDPWFLEKAGRLSLSDYLSFYFDPKMQVFWYRPLYGILILLEYAVFQSEPQGYHLVQILLHLVNCFLLYAVVHRLSGRWRLAALSAILYAGLTPGSWAVYWISVQDPLATAFSLTSLWYWLNYLRTGSKSSFELAIFALAAALLSKESSITLPVVMFLLDRLIIRKRIGKLELLSRYGVVGLVLLAYIAIEYTVQSNGYFPGQQGYGFGPQIVDNLAQYLRLAIFPWGLEQWVGSLWLFSALAILFFSFRNRIKPIPIKWLLFLGIAGGLVMAPVLGFPTTLFEPRYLYTASIASAAAYSLLFEGARIFSGASRWYSVALALLVGSFAVLHSSSTFETAVRMTETSRQARVAIRDIYQQHPDFPPDTYLYFADGCLVRHFTGWFFVRYGSDVTIMCPDVGWGGVDASGAKENRFAGLRDHQNTWVYYYDEAKLRQEVYVDPSSSTLSAPIVPVDFENSIRLEGYEITSTTVNLERELVLFLYWTASQSIDTDYTVFVHLVNASGELLAGEDSPPRNGLAPTKSWSKGKLVVDPHIFHIPPDVPVGGDYRLEVGLYGPNIDRLGIIDTNGQQVTDTLIIQPITIED